MIVQLGDILISKIETLPFIDKKAGVVKVISYKEDKKNGRVISFPASVNTTLEQCEGRYTDLLPDSKKKSVLFLEDRGVRFVEKEGRKMHFRGSVNLVCWLNMPLLGYADQPSISGLAIASIISRFPDTPFNSGIFNMINIQVIGQEAKSVNPFSRYTIDETVKQFLMYPYDYFALAIDIDFMITKDCIVMLEEQLANSCVTK
jgi:hypothetical protein